MRYDYLELLSTVRDGMEIYYRMAAMPFLLGLPFGEMSVNLQFEQGKALLTTAHWTKMVSLSAQGAVLHE